eukprot:GHVQ01012276.1.p3 GENE.GHVQ01012276.1~~GHVQ01012276.1.p3  ORF type:complete len:243 (-),score=34.57 GHVQ01012276.1:1318-2046(-)
MIFSTQPPTFAQELPQGLHSLCNVCCVIMSNKPEPTSIVEGFDLESTSSSAPPPKCTTRKHKKNFAKNTDLDKPTVTVAKRLCCVCGDGEGRYRFRCCQDSYFCNAACFKKHVESGSDCPRSIYRQKASEKKVTHGDTATHKTIVRVEESSLTDVRQTQEDLGDEEGSSAEEETVLNEAQKNNLTNSLCLHEFLGDRRLRQALTAISCSKKPQQSMSRYLTDSYFLQFVDSVVDCVREDVLD